MNEQEDFQYFFPRYIDRPRLIGIFEIDEFFLAFGTMFIMLAVSMAFPKISSLIVMITAISSGIGLAVLYSKFKKNMPDGYTLQKLYRLGIYTPGTDLKAVAIKYPYIKKLGKIIPYGFTKELIS